jgi:YebC/PmpR family DNA-binding regulatory protein
MSGHSKWANIKERKGAQDKKRSAAFTKIAKNILTAIREGGNNTNPATNNFLRVAIDKAKEVNMPKENIERLLAKFEERKANLIGITLEGYGPYGVPIVVEGETDNKNRTLSEIKLLFKNYDGSLGESNSVMFQFKRVGEVELESIPEEKQLDLIDAGAQDFEDSIALVEPSDLNIFKEKVQAMDNLTIVRSGLALRAINPIILNSEDEVAKVMDLIDELEEHDDVINVFAGFDYAQKA